MSKLETPQIMLTASRTEKRTRKTNECPGGARKLRKKGRKKKKEKKKRERKKRRREPVSCKRSDIRRRHVDKVTAQVTQIRND